MYNTLKEHLAAAKVAGNKLAAMDLIGAIDAVDKKIFAEKKAAGDDYLIKDSVVTAVLKNQIKNTKASHEKAVSIVGVTPETDSMLTTVELLKSFLPEAVEGDDLRLLIQSLGAMNMGQAMGMLKKQSVEQGYDYDGKEASVIAKEIFI